VEVEVWREKGTAAIITTTEKEVRKGTEGVKEIDRERKGEREKRERWGESRATRIDA
jgi:hypothetical protein